MSTREHAAGAIYDIGYRKYEGARLGRGYAFRTLFVSGLRTAFGLGRGARAKIIPFVLLALFTVPALMQVGLAGLSGGEMQLIGYDNYFRYTQLMVVLFCAAQAAELVCTDQQHKVLPLYFSRALRRGDYAAAKLLAMSTALLILLLVPQALLFFGRLSLGDDLGAALKAEDQAVVPILGSALVVAVVMGAIAVALASLTSRRAIASAATVAFFLLTAAVAGILRNTAHGAVGDYAPLLNPVVSLMGVITWFFGGPSAIPGGPGRGGPPNLPPPDPLSGPTYLAAVTVMAALAALLLFTRYRKVPV